jgi:putative transposase
MSVSEHSSQRQGFANGYQDKRIDTQAGTLNLRIAKTAKHIDEPFYAKSLERGLRSQRAMMLKKWTPILGQVA